MKKLRDSPPAVGAKAGARHGFMARKPSSGNGGSSCTTTTICALCESSNLASICASCVNYKLNDHHTSLRSLKSTRELLYSKLNDALVAKRKADDQINWRASQDEKLKSMKDRLDFLKKKLSEEKDKVNQVSKDLKLRYDLLDSASVTIEKSRKEILEKFTSNIIYSNRLALMAITSEHHRKQSVVIRQISKLFPMCRMNSDGEKDGSTGLYDQICNAHLPRGLDPHSVLSEELAASLGYMVQLLNLVVPNMAAPALHNSGFAGSCSRIWQRDSYWDARPSSQSKEYPLFIPRQNFCSGGENSWSDRSSSNFDVTSVELERKPYLDTTKSGSFNYASASQHSMETHEDLQKGISLLKKSVACITAYCYNSLCLDVPSEASTFEAFAKLLVTLSSSRQLQSMRNSLKMASSRSDKQVQQLNRSLWKVNPGVSSSSLVESTHTTMMPSARDSSLLNSLPSFLVYGEATELGKSDILVEDWDIVEHPPLPPPPSQVEDVEHWTRAMFIDVTRK